MSRKRPSEEREVANSKKNMSDLDALTAAKLAEVTEEEERDEEERARSIRDDEKEKRKREEEKRRKAKAEEERMKKEKAKMEEAGKTIRNRDKEMDELKAMVLQLTKEVRQGRDPQQAKQTFAVNEDASTSTGIRHNDPPPLFINQDTEADEESVARMQEELNARAAHEYAHYPLLPQSTTQQHCRPFPPPPLLPSAPTYPGDYGNQGAGTHAGFTLPTGGQTLGESVNQGRVQSPFSTGDLSANFRVGAALTKKIVNGEYIDLVDLIDPKAETFTLAWGRTEKGKSVLLEEENKDKRDLTNKEWSKAFLIYMHVYLDKYPEETLPMIQYMHHILELMDGNADWNYYDKNFREERGAQRVKLSWGTFHHMLYA